MSNYYYHQLLKYLYFEGYANSYEEAEQLLEININSPEMIAASEKFRKKYKLSQHPKKAEVASLIALHGPEPFTNPRSKSPSPSPSRSARRVEPSSPSSAVARANRAKIQFKEQYILNHLLNEGYADTVKDAETIMGNMSEEWRQSIVDG